MHFLILCLALSCIIACGQVDRRANTTAAAAAAVRGENVDPMQLAALLLEKTTEQISEDEVSEVVLPGRSLLPRKLKQPSAASAS